MPNYNPQNFNFVFWGTPDVAAETLEILKDSGFMPVFIVTAPDKPQGRKMLLTPPPVKLWALKNDIPYAQPEKLDSDFTNQLKAMSYELNIVVAYGKIMPEEILKAPRLGSYNVHYSLLPKYRGASPVESAVLNGDKETGVVIQKMAFKMDAGPIIAEQKTEIGGDEKAVDLRKRLIVIGGEMLTQTLPKIISGDITEEVQDDREATYCKKIKKEDGLIDLTANPEENYNKLRAYARWPRTFFFKDGKRVIITDASLKDGQFIIKKVLPEGKKEITWKIFNTLK